MRAVINYQNLNPKVQWATSIDHVTEDQIRSIIKLVEELKKMSDRSAVTLTFETDEGRVTLTQVQ